ncbi:hypothetical protein PFNF135_06276 [Plasmodium falciparum NF135/5.C10]|uniref:Duffy-binding-like domain-containing protein n=1 Tax=Plasmodium falciparum NF135/5.C10 TaxID=1036726 RepID=W4I7D5_PLAFA|nr:hypothetical protein PFNF135_06276 [Plasmodium falciparum NF135/5.C10]
MGPKAAAGSGGKDKSAKEVFDEIGEQIQQEVHVSAIDYISELKGDLSKVVFSNKYKVSTGDACHLDYTKDTNVTSGGGKENPCEGRQPVRFSDTNGGYCYNSRIKGNDDPKYGGACAPFRKLHMCDRNLEEIEPEKIESTDNLLVDVLLAAKHEGESLVEKHKEYIKENRDSKICTALARSFADIGDIIRGKDLFLGHKQRKKYLEERLGKMFENIQEKNSRLQDLPLDKLREYWWNANRDQVWKAITCRAGDTDEYFTKSSTREFKFTSGKCGHNDDNVPTYFDYVPQYLRWFEEWAEDFCRKKKHKLKDVKTNCRGKDKSDEYRYCSRNGYDCTKTKPAIGKYRMGNQCTKCLFACNPYVEWIENQRKQFDKQKKKYETEIRKYENGAPVSGRQRRSAHGGSNVNGYEKIFYDKLKGEYRTVDKFLNLLNNEKACKDITDGGRINFKEVNSTSGGTAVSDTSGTNNENEGTFYRSKYCQPCPYCGVRKANNGKWEAKINDDNCKRGNLYKPTSGAEATPINFLYSGDRQAEINKKLEQFCKTQIGNGSVPGGASVSNSDSKELYEDWKCYKGKDVEKVNNGQDNDDEDDDEEDVEEVKNAGGLCILENKNKKEKKSEKEPADIQKTFNNFFYYWVAHMLKDSIHWKKKLERCLQNGNRIKCGNNKCNNDCECFQNWIKQKKTEWGKIKTHFNTQEGFDNEGENGISVGGLGMTADVVLEGVLELEFANENSTEDAENNVSAEEAKEIKHLREIIEKKNQEDEAGASDGKKKTIMDKLIEHEEGIATKCLQKQNECNRQQAAREPAGRSAVPSSPSPAPTANPTESSSEDPEEEEEEEEDEDEDEVEETASEASEASEVEAPPQQETQPAATKDKVNPCEIVETLFTSGDTALQDACEQKYGKTAPTSWKCIPSGDTTSSSGATCIPPRRRKLYVTPLTKWAADEATKRSTSQVNGDGDSSESSDSDSKQAQQHTAASNSTLTTSATASHASNGDALLTAFVESAAVETFFLWHKYKAENTKNKDTQGGGNGEDEENPDTDPETSLKEGKIPDGFLRQMFYTLADYKDILFSGSKDEKSRDRDIFSGDKEMKEKEEKIKGAIQTFFSNSDNKENSGGPKQPNSGTTPEDWWQKNGQAIWDGMICALTYTDSDAKGTPQVDPQVKDKLWDESTNKPKNHDYNSVKLEDESGSKQNQTTSSTSDNTPLTQFVERPPYFRYLEEWGQNFCKERKKRLEEVRKGCRQKHDGGDTFCSGDGHDCTDPKLKHNDMSADLDCRDCYKQCRKYRKWIDIKFDEFHNQKNKYEGEFQKIKGNNNGGDKNCCKDIEKHMSAADFLAVLKHCSNDQTDGEKDEEDEKNKIDFEHPEKTFNPSTYCKACPIYGVTYNTRLKKYKPIDETIYNRKNVIRGENGNDRIPTEIDVLILGREGKNDDKYDENYCKNAGLFEDASFQKWECQKKNGVDQCKLKNFSDDIDDDEHIVFNEFIQRWLRNFIQDYNKLKNKISSCIKNEHEISNKCIKDCNNKCECVGNWLKKKEDEWKKIKDLYKQYSNITEQTIAYNVKSYFVDQGLFDSDYKKAQEVVEGEEAQENLWGNTGINYAISEQTGNNDDFITNLISKLKQKITSCPYEPGQPQPNCVEIPSPDDEEETSLLDDDTSTQEKMSPDFCPSDMPEKPKTDSDILCDGKNEPKCDDFKTYNSNTYKPKIKLIGLGAHNLIARTNSNVYMSPRVRQLCLEQLTKLAVPTKNADLVTEEQFSEALQECAYNEAKSLYEYYKGEGKGMIPIKDNEKIEDKIKEHILEAMKRSYADYGNIVKGDMWWIYPHRRYIDTIIISFAHTFNEKFKSYSVSIDDDAKRLNLWKSIRTNVWKAMLCGYEKAGGNMNSLPNGEKFCILPSTDEEDQFSRWFKEWGENFCIRREQELKQLKDKCKNGICKITDEGEIQECKSLCERYKEFLKNFESQYEKQRILYIELKESISEFKNKDPFTFLKEKCNPQFSCFKDINENESNKIFQHASDEIIKFCTCTSTDTSKTTPTNCIEKAAYELQKEATNKIGSASNSLKIKDNVIDLSDCRKGNYVVVDNGVDGKKIDKDMLKKMFPSNRYSCEPNEINSFHIGKAWDCNYRNINDRDKNLCLPPRRQFMCMKKIEHISAKDVKDKENLLRIVMEIAKEEGIRILRNYQEQNKTQFSEICDDMKYSFADLGDIIRGRDLWKEYPNYHTTEQNLQRIFKNIHNEITKGGDKDKYKYDRQYFHELRNDWWNTNREAIWKAITCSTPRSAYIYKKTNTGDKIRSTDMYYYCGYTKEPPYDDYIPQRLRWMKEWGEYVCKILNEKINDIKKECDKCKINDKTCSDDDDGNKCKSCKEKCREYNKLIHNLKSQLDIQKEIYKELYKKIKDNGIRFTTDSDKEVIEFLKEVEKTGCDVKSFDKYLDKTSHCINYKFNEKEKEKETYAFNLNPKVYKEKCKCGITKDPLDKCPDQNTCTKYHAIQCFGKEHDDNAYWLSTYIKDNKAIIKNVLVPPRRRHLCLRIYRAKFYHLRKEINNFKEFIFSSAFSEAKRLKKVYKDDNDKLLQAMKYSFADIGNIVKGDDMMQSPTSDNIAKIFRGMKYKGIDRTKWWNENKYHVWESMLCGYRKAGGDTKTNENCRFPDIESVPQFLRWFQEWTENFCIQRKKLYDILVAKCKEAKCDENTCDSDPSECTKACRAYENYVLLKKKEYELQKVKYNAQFKGQNDRNEAPQYLKEKCKNGKCACLYEKFNSDNNWEKPYETLDETVKSKCDCKKVEPPPIQPLPSDEPFDPTILQTTIPFGVALALGSIAFLFLKVKENIYVWGICLRVGVFGYIYMWMYMYVFYIYFIYIYVFFFRR